MSILKKIENLNAPLTVVVAGGLAFLLAASYILSSLNLYRRRRQFKSENGCQEPHNRKLWFWGYFDIKRKIKAAKEHKLLELGVQIFNGEEKHTYRVNVMGQEVIMTSEPENIKAILSLRFKDFGLGNRQATLGPLLGHGIFTSDGQPWSESRALIRPNFARDQVADLEAFEHHIQLLLKVIPRDGSTVDLQELFFRFTIDTATEFLFGESTNTLTAEGADAEVANKFAEDFTHAQFVGATRARMGILSRFRPDHKGQASIDFCHWYVDRIVDRAVQYREDLEKGVPPKEDRKYVFLEQLAQATKDKRRLRDELLNVLLAGRDTTASLLSNMWFMLGKHPEVYAKLRREIDETLDGIPPTYEQLRNLKYLKYCMNESLRVHPVVPGNSRMAIKDSIIPVGGGPDEKSPIFVPKGSIVQYSPYAMHHRKDFYGPDADEYRPERWETLRPGWEYLPFNGGPRICIGQQYALTEAGYVTVRLLQEFKHMEGRDPEPWSESLTLTLCSKNGTLVGLTPA